MERLMWMHLVDPSRCSSPPVTAGGTATRPRLSSAPPVWRGYAIRDHRPVGNVVSREDGPNASKGQSAAGVDPPEARVGVARAEHGRLQHARHADVGDEAAGPGGEALTSEARLRGSDHGFSAGTAPAPYTRWATTSRTERRSRRS